MEEGRGSISFFATYRPPAPLEIYSVPVPPNSAIDELTMTDGESYNYNGQVIPPSALNKMLQNPKLKSRERQAAFNSGRLSGLLFVSERTSSLETLHIGLRYNNSSKVEVFNFAQVYGTYNEPRLEDSGCIAGDYLIYVSTRDPAAAHQPWTALWKTHLVTGETDRLTPQGQADLSPSVSPNEKMIAVASFEGKQGGWCGEIEDLQTNIFVINLKTLERKLVVKDGGWPTWGSDNVLFFHRNIEKKLIQKRWGVFRIDIRNGLNSETRVTPENISAVTPAAINDTTVAVATIRKTSKFGDVRTKEQYRHIEVFNSNSPGNYKEITQIIRPLADHFNPFVIERKKGEERIGYHRCNLQRTKTVKSGHKVETTTSDEKDKVDAFTVVETQFHELQSPDPEVGLFRVSGVFPTFSPDGKKLAFVDNEFRAVWVADNDGLRMVYQKDSADSLFAPVWNQNPKLDILYVCVGHSFHAFEDVHICAIQVAAARNQRPKRLTRKFNNAFPSTDPKGERIVFRSTRDHQSGKDRFKNLYIMDADEGDYGESDVTRLTDGNWTDTHCQWSPRGDWIVFSSNRDMPPGTVKPDDLPDAGYFGVYLIKVDTPHTCVKVIDSGTDFFGNLFPGHMNHPYFSPEVSGRLSLVIASDIAAVSCDPISLPLFSHSVRPYGDIFTVELDPDDISNNENLKEYNRITHSRYEASTATWTKFSTRDNAAKWNEYLQKRQNASSFIDPRGGESFLLTGHLCISNRCC